MLGDYVLEVIQIYTPGLICVEDLLPHVSLSILALKIA